MHPLLRIGSRISVLPVIHGSAESALQVRRQMLDGEFDCLAVPLPASFQDEVESGIQQADDGELIPQEDVERSVSKWLE